MKGHLDAAFRLGQIYSFGQGVDVSYMKAKGAYIKGARGGDASCQHMMGMISYEGGYGAQDMPEEVDLKLAVKWFEKAAAQGHNMATYMLGSMTSTAEGTLGSLRRARELFQRAHDLEPDDRTVASMEGTTRAIAKVISQHDAILQTHTEIF